MLFQETDLPTLVLKIQAPALDISLLTFCLLLISEFKIKEGWKQRLEILVPWTNVFLSQNLSLKKKNHPVIVWSRKPNFTRMVLMPRSCTLFELEAWIFLIDESFPFLYPGWSTCIQRSLHFKVP